MKAIQALFALSRQYEESSTTRRFLNLIVIGVEPQADLTPQQWSDLEPYIIQTTVHIKDDTERANREAADYAVHINALANKNKL